MLKIHKFALPVCTVLAMVCLSAAAEDKKDAKPALSGTWAKKGGDLKFEFSDKDVMKISPHGDKADIAIICKYSIDKDGLVKAKLTELAGSAELKEKAKGVLPIGLEFSFTYKIKNDAATLDDVKGENIETLKSHLEGEYEKK
jgi:hypothetical protein